LEKKNSKKSKLIYKLITGATLFVPLPVYLFLMATLFNIVPDYVVYTDLENVQVIEYTVDDEISYFLTTLDNATINGTVDFKDGKYGIYIDSDDIIKIDKKYYSYVEKDEVRQLVDIKKFELQKEQSYKIPLAFFINVFGILVVVLIVQKKMQWHKKYPRLAVFVALLTGTIILFVLNSIIGNILGVFLVATASWAVYCLEYMVHQQTLDESEKNKKESEIASALRRLIN